MKWIADSKPTGATMSNVTILPTAVSTPVINPRRYGRYGVNIVKIKNYTACVGDYCKVINGPNRGKIGRVVNIDLAAPKFKVFIRSVDRPFVTFDAETRKPAGSDNEAWFRASDIRWCPAPAQVMSKTYDLPAWPAHWRKYE